MLNSIHYQSEKGSIYSLCVWWWWGRGGTQKHLNKCIAFKSRSDIYTEGQGLLRNMSALKNGRFLYVKASFGARLPGFDSWLCHQ